MIRRFGEAVRPDRTYKVRHGAYAILPDRESLLITLQQRPVPELQLPGGGIDAGEHPLAALHREVLEETGWRIAPLRRLGAFRRFTYMPEYDLWAEKLCHVFMARPIRPLGPPREADHTAIWISAHDAAAQLANPGDRHFVKTVFGL